MKKYLLSLIVLLLVITGCSQKEEAVVVNEQQKAKEQKVMSENQITNIDKNDFIGEMSIHDAVRARDVEIVKFLISEKSELNSRDKYGYTPLHLASRFDELEIAKLLFNAGATLNSTDNYDDTPLLDSTRNKFSKMSEFLICNGAYRNVADAHDMSPLHYASKTNDLHIANMLRSKDLSDYCQGPLQIAMNDLANVSDHTPTICGNITQGVAQTVSLTLENSDKKSFGPYEADVDNEKDTWCANVTDELENGPYTATALGKDNAANSSEVKDDFNIVTPLGIGIDDVEVVNDNTPLICGDLLQGDIVKADLMLTHKTGMQYGPYRALLNQDNRRWCAQVEDPLKNGNYTAKVIGSNKAGAEVDAQDDMGIHVLNDLYNDLKTEFKDDFDIWDAELDKDTLTFRFKSPQLMFKHGSSILRDTYKDVLNDFYPRYINILKNYKSQIVNVFVEGHTSSVYKLAKNDEERFDYNMKLSDSRAKSVVNYTSSLSSNAIGQNKNWITNTFKPVGKSYSELIRNADGSENQALSRRVEFRIKTIPNEM